MDEELQRLRAIEAAARELFSAQGFPSTYDLLDGELTKTEQNRLVGNSVVPQLAEAVVRANIGDQCVRKTA